MARFVCLCLISLLFGISSFASDQDKASSELSSFIEKAMSDSNIPGLAVVLFDENGITYERVFGVADTENRPVTLETPFQIGSVSKSFAALAILQLSAEGHLKLDDPIIKYLPYFKTKNPALSNQITVKQALTHMSGLSMFDGNRRQNDEYRDTEALEIAVKRLSQLTLKTPPGEAHEYSNANYLIAAAVIEAITKQPYEEVIDTRIFRPLNMTQSYVQMPLRQTVDESMGFRQWFGYSVGQRKVPGRMWMGAGGVTTSAKDLAVYVKAVSTKDPRIVPPEFADALTTPVWQSEMTFYDYGFGWMFIEMDGREVVYHSGLNGGFSAQSAFLPSEKRGGVVLINQSGALQADVAGAVLKKGLDLPLGAAAPSLGQHLTVWGLLATVITLAASSIISMFRFKAYARSVSHVPIARRVIPVIALFSLAFALYFFVPYMNAVPLNSIGVFQPDIWLCLTLSILILVIWGFARLVCFR